MACLALLAQLMLCGSTLNEETLIKQYVDYSVGLYFREYLVEKVHVDIIYQLVPGLEPDPDQVVAFDEPFMIDVNGVLYRVDCDDKKMCRLVRYL